MKITRRETIKTMGVLAMAYICSTAASCKDIYNEILQYVGVGIQAAVSVVALLSANGITATVGGMLLSAVLTEIKNLWGDVSAAVSDYESTPTTTAGQKVALALALVSEYLQKFWTDLMIPDTKLANTVKGLIGLVIATIEGFLPQLPPVQKPKLVMGPKARLYVVAKRMDVKTFKKDFNGLLTAGGYSKYAI